ELVCRRCLFSGPIARSLPSSERDSAVQVRRGRSDHANPRVTLEAGRIFHSAGVMGSSVPQPPLCPAQLPRACLSLSRLPRTRLSLSRLPLVSSAPGFSDVSELTCFSRVESHGRPRRGVGEVGRFVTAVGAAEDAAVVESVLR